ncbi:MAG: DUF4358 domain-containing protein [Ruminococcaceae bacterium]|nr:DUF4358 domain-containing protein [Oscillospiraceae bacterium]
MKKISILVVIAMLMTLIASCGGSDAGTKDVPTRDLLTAAIETFTEEEMKNPIIYYSDAAEGSPEALDPGLMSFYFYGEYDIDMPVMAMVDEYAMAIPSGLFAFEVNILKAKSPSAANEVKKMMDSRLTVKQKDRGEIENYDATQLPAFDSAEIFVIDKYVILIASSDNAKIKAAINGLLGSDSASADVEGELDKIDLGESGIKQIESSVQDALTGGSKTPVGSSQPSENASALPEMTVSIFSANDCVFMGGKCVEGAKIHVRGGLMDYTFGTDAGNWMVEVQIPNGISTLYVTQEEPGKDESPAIELLVQSRTDVDFSSHGACMVSVGDNAQGHFWGQMDDWMGKNLMTDKQITGVQSRIKTRVDYLKGMDCELIYVIVPNPISIYPETAPAKYPRSTEETTRTEQFVQAATAAGATVIELTETMMEHRDDEYKIYHKTDSHWTDYGAYWGHYELFSYISQTWPDAKPLEIGTHLEFYNKEVDAGDMMTHLELKNSLIKENATFVKWLTDRTGDNPNIYVDNRNELIFDPVNQTKTIINWKKDGKELPTAMVIRDSYSTNIYTYINTCFSEVYWQNMWSYKFDQQYIKEKKPDYYIILLTERNLGNVFG